MAPPPAGTRTAAASSSPGQAVDAAVGRIQTERGTPFLVGPSFYKPESTPSRDLAVLAALVYKRQTGRGLRVLDVMSGCGVRGARYLDQVHFCDALHSTGVLWLR